MIQTTSNSHPEAVMVYLAFRKTNKGIMFFFEMGYHLHAFSLVVVLK